MIDPRRDMLLLCPTCNEFRTFRWDCETSIGVCSTCGRDNLDGGGTPGQRAQGDGWATQDAAALLALVRSAARAGADYPASLRYWAERVDAAQRTGGEVPYDNAAIRAACSVLRGAA